jgi:hypothetical protein
MVARRTCRTLDVEGLGAWVDDRVGVAVGLGGACVGLRGVGVGLTGAGVGLTGVAVGIAGCVAGSVGVAVGLGPTKPPFATDGCRVAACADEMGRMNSTAQSAENRGV